MIDHDQRGPCDRPDAAGSAPAATIDSTLVDVNQMIEQHLALVRKVSFQLAANLPRHVDREELLRAGELGLVEAARRFDESRGVPFAQFAKLRIRGAMLDVLRADDWAPRSVRTLAKRVEATEQRLAVGLGRMPTSRETAATLGLTAIRLHGLRSEVDRSTVMTFDRVLRDGGSDEDVHLLDILAGPSNLEPFEELELRERYALIQDAIEVLPERLRFIIVGYFLEEMTSLELARFLGVTVSRISQLRFEALSMLKRGLQAQYGPVPETTDVSTETKDVATTTPTPSQTPVIGETGSTPNVT